MNQIDAWGKLNQQGKSHPLTAHMLDVSACFCAIARVDSLRRALTRAAGRPHLANAHHPAGLGHLAHVASQNRPQKHRRGLPLDTRTKPQRIALGRR
nr:HD domain-containing protein [Limnohabitans sp. 2KL-3]